MCKLNINNLNLDDCEVADIQITNKKSQNYGRKYKHCYREGKRISQKEYLWLNELADQKDCFLTEETKNGNFKHSHYLRFTKEWKKKQKSIQYPKN